jgi:hypothetical protein
MILLMVIVLPARVCGYAGKTPEPEAALLNRRAWRLMIALQMFV